MEKKFENYNMHPEQAKLMHEVNEAFLRNLSLRLGVKTNPIKAKPIDPKKIKNFLHNFKS